MNSVWKKLKDAESVFSENSANWLCARGAITNFLKFKKFLGRMKIYITQIQEFVEEPIL
jgi:hypothetical protein